LVALAPSTVFKFSECDEPATAPVEELLDLPDNQLTAPSRENTASTEPGMLHESHTTRQTTPTLP